MPAGEALNDDYVASLLLKDAEANKRSLSRGLGSLLSKPRSKDAPKPNTRFLRNIIRQTDNHNAAIKAKEEEESRTRLKELRNERAGEKRAREEGHDEGSSKRRRGEDKPGRWASALSGLGTANQKNERRREERRGGSDRSRARDGDERRRDRSREHHEREKKHRRRHDRARSRSPERSREKRRRRRSHSRSPTRKRSPPKRTPQPSNERDSAHLGSDSDPLDEIIGPKPPPKVQTRGRGAQSSGPSIDARFNPSYDPKADVNLSPDDGDRGDWDMALEALRDRAKWQAQGASRLRAAGFTDEEVSKWEKGNGGHNAAVERDIEDVRWRKKGEGREWDRGKVVAEDGDVELRPEWGRLKGT